MDVAQRPPARGALLGAARPARPDAGALPRRRHEARLGRRGAARPSSSSTAGLDRIVEHNAGDLTAVLEAGVPLADAQALFARRARCWRSTRPTRRHDRRRRRDAATRARCARRYGGPRDLVVGMRVALSDGTVAQERRQGDQERRGLRPRQALRRLVRDARGDRRGVCAPAPARRRTRQPRVGAAVRPDALGRGAAARAAPLEQQGLDVALGAAAGRVLVRFGGAAARPQAEAAERLLARRAWRPARRGRRARSGRHQRDGQRAAGPWCGFGAADRPRRCCGRRRRRARWSGRAGLGLSWVASRTPRRGSARASCGRLPPRACLDRAGRARGRPVGRLDPRAPAL